MRPLTMPDEALYLVDGSGFVFRAYHALPPLTTKAGVPSGAVYGFTTMLMKLEMDHRPPYLAVVFDAGAKSFRDDLYPAYKANRPEPPDDLKPQFGLVRRVVEAFGLPMLEAANFEADDLIATLVRRAKERSLRVVVVSSDKDLMQLVDDRCVLLDTMKDMTYGPPEVEAKFGVAPGQLGDVLALMGDSVDNVPGVPGVGPKTASALIREFGSLDALLARLGEVPGLKTLRGAASVAAKLKAHEQEARLSRKLVTLDEHVDFPGEIESFRRREPNWAQVEGLLRELEFFRLIDRLRPAAGLVSSSPAAEIAAKEIGGAVVAAPIAVDSSVKLGVTPPRILTDEPTLRAFVGELARRPEIGLTVEAAGTTPMAAQLVGLGFALDGAAPAYVPLGHRYLGAPVQLSGGAAFAALRPLLEAERPKKFVQGATDAEVLLALAGVKLRAVASDPGIASYLLDPTPEHELKPLCHARFGAVIPDRAELLGTGKRALSFEALEVGRAAAFAACQAEAALALGRKLLEEIQARGLTKLHDEMEMSLAHVLAIIERHGVLLDVPALRALGAEVDRRLAAIEEQVRKVTGSEVNLGSPKQIQELLFEKLGLPASKRTKTGFSVDADVLEELATLNPIAAQILEHRTLSKLKGTYIDTLPSQVDPRTGRLHTVYKQTIAATGRLSSVEPNLQNVPVRTELGREIRRAFHAGEGATLVVCDYSQIELRVLAHLSKDPVLTDAFRKDQDIHTRTVIEMFGADKVADKQLRSVAKMINYGILYGLSDYGLAQRLGIDRGEAKRYIEGYLATYAGVKSYLDRLVEEAYREGGSRTLLGRFRPLPELAARNRNVRQAGERMARNTPIQGTAADLLKLAMIAAQRYIDEQASDVKMLLTVHDELVFEVPEARLSGTPERLRGVMESVMALDVPLKVDLGVGRTWADAK